MIWSRRSRPRGVSLRRIRRSVSRLLTDRSSISTGPRSTADRQRSVNSCSSGRDAAGTWMPCDPRTLLAAKGNTMLQLLRRLMHEMGTGRAVVNASEERAEEALLLLRIDALGRRVVPAAE